MTEIITVGHQPAELAAIMAQAAHAADNMAAAGVFDDYTGRKSANTIRRQLADLAAFRAFLTDAGIPSGELAKDPQAWQGVTWGLVEAFKRWLLLEGYAVTTINFRLSSVKIYCKLAMKAGAIDPQTYALIHAVEGYAHREAKHIDDQRTERGQLTRRGYKKIDAVSISTHQAHQLKAQPDTPQGRRDAVLMCILLDHGLRCGEVSLLQVEHIDLAAGTIMFYRPKVQRVQTHTLTRSAAAALKSYLETDHPMQTGPLLLTTRKGGHRGAAGGPLAGVGMRERSITARVRYLGELVGLAGLSAHDCRHYWATQAARNRTPIDRLRDAGGWSSLAMPGRYIENAKIANEGVNLGSD